MAGNRMTWQRALAIGSSMAMTLACLVGGGYFLGRYLDGRWGTQPWLTLVCMLVGLTFGGINLVQTLKEFWSADE